MVYGWYSLWYHAYIRNEMVYLLLRIFRVWVQTLWLGMVVRGWGVYVLHRGIAFWQTCRNSCCTHGLCLYVYDVQDGEVIRISVVDLKTHAPAGQQPGTIKDILWHAPELWWVLTILSVLKNCAVGCYDISPQHTLYPFQE